jgi:spore photoproduct lyase
MINITDTYFQKLPQKEQTFLKEATQKYHLSQQDRKQLIDIAVDLDMWEEKNLSEIWPHHLEERYQGKKLKQTLIAHVKAYYNSIKESPTSYEKSPKKIETPRIKFITQEKDNLGFGLCPVASPKTRCCNLLTLDAVESCGFDCSYCSIQSFYNDDKITFDSALKKKLDAIELDANEFYHIGTGQASDSLMWGNQNGVLDDLVDFATKYPNVMLEFKTKSDNISYFLDKDLPPNLLFTWSLNPQEIIENEEHLTASLARRLRAAKRLADKGCLVGFHFHPMIYFKGWKEAYGEIFKQLITDFHPDSVVLVSLGTLTFIKPVMKQIRQRDFKSKILQIPLVEASGKLSYPLEIKKELFSFAYQALKPWHGKVYFYMCMENHTLWRDVFGYEYPTNESFEMDMKLHYLAKIQAKASSN